MSSRCYNEFEFDMNYEKKNNIFVYKVRPFSILKNLILHVYILNICLCVLNYFLCMHYFSHSIVLLQERSQSARWTPAGHWVSTVAQRLTLTDL